MESLKSTNALTTQRLAASQEALGQMSTAANDAMGVLIALSGITSQDQLLRSNSSMALPLGAIHVPPRDSGIVLQGSVAVQASPGGTEAVKLTPHNDILPLRFSDQTSELRGPSSLTT